MNTYAQMPPYSHRRFHYRCADATEKVLLVNDHPERLHARHLSLESARGQRPVLCPRLDERVDRAYRWHNTRQKHAKGAKHPPTRAE